MRGIPNRDREKLSLLGSESTPRPRWYSPQRMLSIFFALTILQFCDQGTLGSNGVTGQGQGVVALFDLTEFQSGCLPAAYTLGFLVAAFSFSELSRTRSAFRLVGFGCLIWSAGLVLTGSSFSFWFLLAARVLAGAGEASVATLSFPFVDDSAPPKSKSTYFAILALAQALGTAIGFVYGGLMASAVSWRACFWILAALGVPLMLFTLLAPEVQLRHVQTHQGRPTNGVRSTLVRIREACLDLLELMRQPAWNLNNLGNVGMWSLTAVLGYWGTKAAVDLYGFRQDTADIAIGALTITTAVVGTLCGGVVFDRLGATLRSGFALMLAAAVVATGGLLGAMWVPHPPLALTLMAVGLLGLFFYQAPSFALSMWTAPRQYRPLSQAMLALTHYLLGDLPAPPATGAIHGALQPSLGTAAWRVTLTIIFSLYLLPAGLLYLFGTFLAASGRATDFRLSEVDAAALLAGEGGELDRVGDADSAAESSPAADEDKDDGAGGDAGTGMVAMR